jgi:hypothetical protein
MFVVWFLSHTRQKIFVVLRQGRLTAKKAAHGAGGGNV